MMDSFLPPHYTSYNSIFNSPIFSGPLTKGSSFGSYFSRSNLYLICSCRFFWWNTQHTKWSSVRENCQPGRINILLAVPCPIWDIKSFFTRWCISIVLSPNLITYLHGAWEFTVFETSTPFIMSTKWLNRLKSYKAIDEERICILFF